MLSRRQAHQRYRLGVALWLLPLIVLAPMSVGATQQSTDLSDKALAALGLEVAVVVFDDGVDAFDERDARHVLRKVEAQLLTVLLRDVLTDAQRWGPVRVLPKASQLAALTLTGSVRTSNGSQLIIDLQAIDAADRVWLDQRFVSPAKPLSDRTSPSEQIAYEADASGINSQSGSQDALPFAELFTDIERALADALENIPLHHLARLAPLSQLRYGAELAPDVFADYFRVSDEGVTLLRLPAADDPMLERIERIRRQETLFIDTVDEQYVDLQQQLLPTYLLWLQSVREQAAYLADYTQRAASRETLADAGSFAAMQQAYATYRSLRIQEQDLFELANGFTNETEPTVMRTDDRVVRLSGTLDTQYQQWRQLLAQIMRLERGLSP